MAKQKKQTNPGQAIANAQRVGYLEADECVLFCDLMKKAKIQFREQPAGNIRLIRVGEVKFYSDKELG